MTNKYIAGFFGLTLAGLVGCGFLSNSLQRKHRDLEQEIASIQAETREIQDSNIEKETKEEAQREIEDYREYQAPRKDYGELEINDEIKIALQRLAPYEEQIQENARDFGVSTSTIRAIIMTESSGKPNIKSHTGANGLMQVMYPAFNDVYHVLFDGDPGFVAIKNRMPGIEKLAEDLKNKKKAWRKLKYENTEAAHRFNIDVGSAYFAALVKRHNDPAEALRRYLNGGTKYNDYQKHLNRFNKWKSRFMRLEKQGYFS